MTVNSSPERSPGELPFKSVSQALTSLNMNELAERFDEYMSRIEAGHANEPITAMATSILPTYYFSMVLRFWIYWSDEDYDAAKSNNRVLYMDR